MKKLKQDMVTTYAKMAKQKNDIEKKLTVLRKKIIVLMERGYISPKNGPYLLELTYQDRHPIAWKEEWMDLAKVHFGKKGWKAAFKQLLADAELVRTPMLLPKINAKYRVVDQENIVEFKRKAS